MLCSKGQLHHTIHHHHCRSGQQPKKPLEQFQAFGLLRWIFAFAAGRKTKGVWVTARVKVDGAVIMYLFAVYVSPVLTLPLGDCFLI